MAAHRKRLIARSADELLEMRLATMRGAALLHSPLSDLKQKW